MKPDRLLDLFCELARIESPSRREALMAKRCKAELEGLGFTVRFDDSAERTGSDAGNLIAFRAGSAAGAVALCGHMDTVRPCKGIEPVVEDGVTLGCVIADKDVHIRRGGTLIGHESYPLAVSKGSIV